MKWINVKDRLPEDGRAYFCFTNCAVMAYSVLRYYDGAWRNEIGREMIVTVSHWMELPEPPETS